VRGFRRLEESPYEVIVCLDADITFPIDYFSFLLEKLTAEKELGLIGTPYVESDTEPYDYHFVSIEHVAGACQVFRRECYEDIGGYAPVKVGAIDCIAVITARMKGWKTRTFTEKVCLHHREMGTAQRGPLQAKFDCGVMDYAMGNHPLWQLFRTAYQMTKKPYLLRGFAIGAGYLWQCVRFRERPISRELLRFHRREQMQRLKRFFTGQGLAKDQS